MSTSQTPDRDILSDPDGLRARIAELEREHDERERAEQAFQSLVAGTSSKVGEAFFPALARHLATALDVRHVFVTALTNDSPARLRTLACWCGNGIEENIEYETADTPCARVLQEGVFHCAEHVQALFPTDETLVEMGAVSFVGVWLEGSSGEPIGHLCVLDDKPMPDAQGAIAILRLFATRATVELERMRAEEEQRAREQQYRERDAVLVRLARRQATSAGDFVAALREITRAAAHTLAVDRVSAWLYNDDHSKIHCVDLYELSHDRHSAGAELTAAEYPTYFLALEEDRIIAADDARHDPRTREFKREYLEPLQIVSMLDAPIRVDGQSIGVICHEQIGAARHWSSEDCAFAAAIADSIALSRQACDRRETQRALEEQRLFLRQVLDITPNMIFVKDRDGRFTLVNQSVADSFGTTVDEVIGRTDADFDQSPDEVAFFRQIDRQVMETQREHFIPEESVTDSSGLTRWLQTVKRPIVDDSGVANHVLAVRRRHRALQQAIDMRSASGFDTIFFATRDVLTWNSEVDRPFDDITTFLDKRGIDRADFDLEKFKTPHLIASRVFDADGSQTAIRMQTPHGFYLDDAMRDAAEEDEDLPFSEQRFHYFLHIVCGAKGLRDLSGNPIDLQAEGPARASSSRSSSASTPVAATEARASRTTASSPLVRRFSSADEDERPNYYLDSEVEAGAAGSIRVADLFGPVSFSDEGELLARPATRSRKVVDGINQLPPPSQTSVLRWCPPQARNRPQIANPTGNTPFGQAIQNPFNPLGCRLQMAWREVDMSLSRTDPQRLQPRRRAAVLGRRSPSNAIVLRRVRPGVAVPRSLRVSGRSPASTALSRVPVACRESGI